MADYGRIVDEQASLMKAHTMPVSVGADVENAETDGHSIYVNPSFMSQVESSAGEDGVRFVLSHELGHAYNGMALGGQSGEFAADSFATRSVALAGGSFESIGAVFGMLGSSDTETHPGSGRRATAAIRDYDVAHGEYVDRDLADQQLVKNEPVRARGRDLKV